MESGSYCVRNHIFNNWLGDKGNEDSMDSESDSKEGHYSNPSSTNTDFSSENLISVLQTPTREPQHQPPVLSFQNILNSNPGNELITNMEVPEIDTEVENDHNSYISNNAKNINEGMKDSSIAQALLPLLSDLCQLTKKVGRFGLKLLSMKVIDKKTFDKILEERDGHMRIYRLYNGALNSNANKSGSGGPGQMLEALLTSGNENVFEFIKARVLDPTILAELRRIEGNRDQGCQGEETKLVEGEEHPVPRQIEFQRRLRPPCSSHRDPTLTACREFSEETRQRIFDVLWTAMNQKERRDYVTSLIQLVPWNTRQLFPDGAECRCNGNAQWLYVLELNGQKRRVCLKMFTSTLALSVTTIRRCFRQQASPRMASTWSPLSNCQVNHEEAMPDPNDLAKTSVYFTSRTTSAGNMEGHRHDSSDSLSVDFDLYS